MKGSRAFHHAIPHEKEGSIVAHPTTPRYWAEKIERVVITGPAYYQFTSGNEVGTGERVGRTVQGTS